MPLLDRIAERADNAGAPPARAGREAIADSVVDHLRKLLNTRSGGASAAPDFGLPDLNESTFSMADGTHHLEVAIQRCIEAYEPRLSGVRVRHVPGGVDPCRLRFSIVAALDVGDHDPGARVSFETVMDGSGHVRVWG